MSKIRVRDMEMELNLTKKELKTKLQKMGVEVKSHMSGIDEETEKKVREVFTSPEKKQNNEPDKSNENKKINDNKKVNDNKRPNDNKKTVNNTDKKQDRKPMKNQDRKPVNNSEKKPFKNNFNNNSDRKPEFDEG